MLANKTAASLARPRVGRLLLRVLAGILGMLVLFLILVFLILERAVHRPSPLHANLTPEEIEREDARLKQVGLVLRDGSFLEEHPFAPPWTSHSLLMPAEWVTGGPTPLARQLLGSHRVRADLLRSDLDVLEPVMERAYGGWDSAASRGWNWTEWFSNWRQQLAGKGNAQISFDEAFSAVDKLLAFQRDNHTQIPLDRFLMNGDGSQTAILASSPGAACSEIRAGNGLFQINPTDAGQRVRSAKLWISNAGQIDAAHYVAMPASYGAPQAVRCGGAWIPLQSIGSQGSFRRFLGEVSSDNKTRIERLGDGIVYARLPTFDWSNYANLSRAGWATHQPGDRVLIVDLRNNGGGSYGYGHEALRGWIDESRMVSWEKFGKEVNASCLYPPFRWNEGLVLGPGLVSGEKASLQMALDAIAQSYPEGCPRAVEATPAQWGYMQHKFAPPTNDLRIIALVNSRCGSDCELFTAQLASLRETIVAGENTYGVGQFIQPGYSVLPATGLKYRIALGRSDMYGDKRSFDGYGLDVDILVAEVDSLQKPQLRELVKAVEKMCRCPVHVPETKLRAQPAAWLDPNRCDCRAN